MAKPWLPNLFLLLFFLDKTIVCGLRINRHFEAGAPLPNAVRDDDFGALYSRNWTFLGRFAFEETGGYWSFDLTAEQTGGAPMNFFQKFRILTLWDEQWDFAYSGGNADCQELSEISDNRVELVRNLTRISSTFVQCFRHSPFGDSGNESEYQTWKCSGYRHMQDLARDRYWFFLFHCCNCEQMEVSIDVHLTNGHKDWFREFSADESWLLSMYLVSFLSYLLALYFHWKNEIKNKIKAHMIKSLFKFSLEIQTLTVFCYLLHYWTFKNDGVGIEGSRDAADLLWCFGEVLFIDVLLLLAKGWTVYRPTLRELTVYKMITFSVIYIVVYLVVTVQERRNYDPGTVTFRYDSFWGRILSWLYVIGWLAFTYAIYTSVKPSRFCSTIEERVNDGGDVVCPKEKLPFFYALFSVFSAWFLVIPITHASLIAYAGAHNRTNWGTVVLQIRQIIGYIVLLLLWIPHRKNQFFPFERSVGAVGVQTDGEEQREPEPEPEEQANIIIARRGIFQVNPEPSQQEPVQDNEAERKRLAARLKHMSDKIEDIVDKDNTQEHDRSEPLSLPNQAEVSQASEDTYEPPAYQPLSQSADTSGVSQLADSSILSRRALFARPPSQENINTGRRPLSHTRLPSIGSHNTSTA
eukprot:m.72416 g.72416  ORF g.72416 m.72416 type:complete len:637 (+) comp12325_c0_seq1:1336-3246(+)